ncbi:tetratricopeptide repeat protein [Sandaracinobacteroides hominis]|uniref:tetratricopeptide repeat protein n=1 Tax=Sandaracinobacteroides hominis TaxID=2780086 RepID=UPI0018F5CB48|nr:tetratricopeptide repeat protein [Sandaracinobacteroides hominis]
MRQTLPLGAMAPLAFGAALAAAGGADARTTAPEGMRAVGPDPVATATAEAARAQGKALLGLNKPVEALRSYRQALLQDPDSVETLNGLAVCYDRLGRFEDSRTHYEMALGIDPASPTLLYNYGLSLYLQKKPQEAVRFLTLAAASDDEQVQAASLRTLARIEQQRARAAIAPAVSVSAPEEASGSARIVRTNAHEQRLVLDAAPRGRPGAVQTAVASTRPQAGTPAISPTLSADLSPEAAAATVALASLTPREDARIAAREYAAIAADQAALEARQAEALAAAAAAAPIPLPEAMAQVQRALASRQMRVSPATSAGAELAAVAFAAPGGDPLDWQASHFLDFVPSRGRETDVGERRQAHLALLSTGLAVPRPVARARAVAAEPVDPGLRKREFADPFNSDNSRLNGFADRLHGREELAPAQVAEQVARLEALIARVRNA